MKKALALLLLILITQFIYSQERYVTEEQFKEKISWLEPHEMLLPLRDIIKKIPGAGSINKWLVDGIVYEHAPFYLYAAEVKYIEVVNNILQANTCQCDLIVKTLVTEKEFNSRKNILNRLNKNRPKKSRKQKNKKKK